MWPLLILNISFIQLNSKFVNLRNKLKYFAAQGVGHFAILRIQRFCTEKIPYVNSKPAHSEMKRFL